MMNAASQNRAAFTALIVVLCIAGCGPRRPREPALVPNAPSAPVYFGPAPFVYRVGPQLSTTSVDSAEVRARLGNEGARLGCDAVADVVISPAGRGFDARTWGFCAFRGNRN